ncbi:translation elongation factor Ts [Membranicola marinus]|uniref:Elongation factor Ts n=1 Tax=Membranihabitans marinus TaxID=1227546 RepID=A0A953HWV4_9BACT|nr:translation elongation factor Ts [Membranihabitans marinus]MBY5959710.1 translation elongation factor Ts [Membranihabitans marinus]
MSKITAADVKKLRDQTGAGMMDVKKALVEAEGDAEKAIEILRKKGQKLSMKRAGREAKEGVVIAKVCDENTKGIVIRLSCETDFVAKNDDFIDFADQIAGIALENMPESKEALEELELDGKKIKDLIVNQVGVIGEKIELADYESLEAETVVPYIHMGYRAGVIVGLNQTGDEVVEAGKNVAMQIAAMKPLALDKDGVDESIVEKEIEIGKEQARQEGKPEQILEKIAKGKLNKFFQENTLLAQSYVKDSKQSVSDYLKSIDKDLTVTGYKHLMLG